MVSSIRKSTHAADILQDQPKLQQKNVTRWNSSNRMLKSILNVDSAILSQVKTPTTLSKQDLKTIKEITDILTPFEMVTAHCEGEKTVTSSLVIPLTFCLKLELQELTDQYKSPMLTALINSVNTRLTPYQENELFQLATMLDPRYKLQCFQPDTTSTMTDLLASKVNLLTPSNPPAAPELSSPPKKKSKLLRHLQRVPAAQPTTPSQVQAYLSAPALHESADPLLFWQQHQQQYPDLARLTRL